MIKIEKILKEVCEELSKETKKTILPYRIKKDDEYDRDIEFLGCTRGLIFKHAIFSIYSHPETEQIIISSFNKGYEKNLRNIASSKEYVFAKNTFAQGGVPIILF